MITPFGLSTEQTTTVLGAACRAPSLHNSQPWCFQLSADRIEIHLDPRRRLAISDPDRREARLAGGAALFDLRLALARYGVLAEVTIPSDGDAAPLAIIENGGDCVLSPERADLYRAINHRRTNRQPFFDAEVPAGHRRILARAAEVEGAALHTVTDAQELAHLHRWTGSSHRTQLADPAWRAELAAWTGRSGQDAGVPLSAAGPRSSSQDVWTLRDFGRDGRADAEDDVITGDRDDDSAPSSDKLFEERPLIAVLGTYLDQPGSQVQAGQAMQRVLLTATNLGLAASFLSQLIEVRAAREQVQLLIGGRIHPQVVLRIGFGGPVPTTPRRSVLDCVMVPAP